jgi:hypothetical protein
LIPEPCAWRRRRRLSAGMAREVIAWSEPAPLPRRAPVVVVQI